MQSALDRRQAIMEALSDRRFETLENLATEFGVTTRTIQNDITVLGCSVPIYTVQGNGGGIRVAYAVKTTTVSELISGMERIHMPKEVTIPLTVMFRFFPTVFQESEAISDAMKMRGIKLGGKKSSKILEYKLIPMITCSVKIGEELSAAAITRGLGAPVKRTNICQLKFNFADVVLILFCCFVVFWAIASPIISAGGILP